MAQCANRNSPDFKRLERLTGYDPSDISMAIGLWQDHHNTEMWPSSAQVRAMMQNRQGYGGIDLYLASISKPVHKPDIDSAMKNLPSRIELIMSTLKTILPDVTVKLHSSQDTFTGEVKRVTGDTRNALGNGFFDDTKDENGKKRNVIHLNVQRMVEVMSDQRKQALNTAEHEAVHPILDYMETIYPGTTDRMFKQLQAVEKKMGLDGKYTVKFAGRYAPKWRAEEAVTEFIADVASGNIDLSKISAEKRNAIVELFLRLLDGLGIRENVKGKIEKDIVAFAKEVRDAMGEGRKLNVRGEIEHNRAQETIRFQKNEELLDKTPIDEVYLQSKNKNLETNEITSSARGKQQERSGIYRALKAATSDTRGDNNSSEKNRQGGWNKERFLRRWAEEAKANGVWIENIEEVIADELKAGNESETYISKDLKDVIKVNRFALLDEDDSGVFTRDFNSFLDRIISHNEFAKSVPYTIIGGSENKKGEISIVLKQPYIKNGKYADLKDIYTFLNKAGFKPSLLENGVQGFTDGRFEISDVKPENVLQDTEGNLHFIDIDINSVEPDDEGIRFQNYEKENKEIFGNAPIDELYLQQISKHADEIEQGISVYKRFTQEEQGGLIKGGKILIEASIITGRKARAGASQDAKNNRQEKDIEAYAKLKGIWMPDTGKLKDKYSYLTSGKESLVYDNGETVIKSKNTLQYRDLQDALDGIVIHNEKFPDSAIRVIGFGKNREKDFQIILEQVYVKGQARNATNEEIQELLKGKGLKVNDKKGNHHFINEEVLVNDLHEDNVLVAENGDLVVIDSISHLNTEVWGYGGTRRPVNEIGDTREIRFQNINNKNGKQKISKTTEGVSYLHESTDNYPTRTDDIQRSENRKEGNDNSVKAVWKKIRDLQFSGTTKVKNAEDVAQIMSLLESKTVEHAFAIHIDEKGNSHIQFLSIGGIAGTVIDGRLVSAGVTKFKSKKVYLVHNHPSGNMNPSRQDIEVTKKIREGLNPLGITMEHIIMDTYKKEYIHIDNENAIQLHKRGENEYKNKLTPIALTDQEILKENIGKVNNSTDVFSLIQNFRFSAMPKNAMLVLDYKNEVIANYVLNNGLKYQDIIANVGETGIGTSIIFYGNQNNIREVNEIKTNLSKIDITTLDYVVVSSNNDAVKGYYKSMSDEGLLHEHQEKYGTNSVEKTKFQNIGEVEPSLPGHIENTDKRDKMTVVGGEYIFFTYDKENYHTQPLSFMTEAGYKEYMVRLKPFQVYPYEEDPYGYFKGKSFDEAIDIAKSKYRMLVTNKGEEGRLRAYPSGHFVPKENTKRDIGIVNKEIRFQIADTEYATKSDFEKDIKGNVKKDAQGNPILTEKAKKEIAEEYARIENTYDEKAPNGKPSKLSKEQWVQVRTSRFKKWFGDWEIKEKNNNFEKNNSDNDERTKIGNQLEEVLGRSGAKETKVGKNESINQRTNRLSPQEFREKLEDHSKRTGKYIEYIKSIAGRQLPGGHESEVYLSKEGTTVLKVNRMPFIDNNFSFNDWVEKIIAHNYLFPDLTYTIKGVTKNSKGEVSIVLEQPTVNVDVNRITTQEEIDNKLTEMGFVKKGVGYTATGTYWENGLFRISDVEPKNVLRDVDGDLYFIDPFVTRIKTNNEEVSKVVDENGEPLVMYHGSYNLFNEFSKEKRGLNTESELGKLGFFFSSSKEISGSYATENAREYNNAIKEERDSRESILEITGEDWYYSKINFKDNKYDTNLINKLKPYFNKNEKSKEFIEAFEEDNSFSNFENKGLATGAKIYEVFLNIRKPLIINELNVVENEKRIIENITKNKNIDGVVIYNTMDIGDMSYVEGEMESDIYIAIEPSQIKSATDNTGNFSEGTGDIRFQTHDNNIRFSLNETDNSEGKKDAYQESIDYGNLVKAIRALIKEGVTDVKTIKDRAGVNSDTLEYFQGAYDLAWAREGKEPTNERQDALSKMIETLPQGEKRPFAQQFYRGKWHDAFVELGIDVLMLKQLLPDETIFNDKNINQTWKRILTVINDVGEYVSQTITRGRKFDVIFEETGSDDEGGYGGGWNMKALGFADMLSMVEKAIAEDPSNKQRLLDKIQAEKKTNPENIEMLNLLEVAVAASGETDLDSLSKLVRKGTQAGRVLNVIKRYIGSANHGKIRMDLAVATVMSENDEELSKEKIGTNGESIYDIVEEIKTILVVSGMTKEEREKYFEENKELVDDIKKWLRGIGLSPKGRQAPPDNKRVARANKMIKSGAESLKQILKRTNPEAVRFSLDGFDPEAVKAIKRMVHGIITKYGGDSKKITSELQKEFNTAGIDLDANDIVASKDIQSFIKHTDRRKIREAVITNLEASEDPYTKMVIDKIISKVYPKKQIEPNSDALEIALAEGELTKEVLDAVRTEIEKLPEGNTKEEMLKRLENKFVTIFDESISQESLDRAVSKSIGKIGREIIDAYIIDPEKSVEVLAAKAMDKMGLSPSEATKWAEAVAKSIQKKLDKAKENKLKSLLRNKIKDKTKAEILENKIFKLIAITSNKDGSIMATAKINDILINIKAAFAAKYGVNINDEKAIGDIVRLTNLLRVARTHAKKQQIYQHILLKLSNLKLHPNKYMRILLSGINELRNFMMANILSGVNSAYKATIGSLFNSIRAMMYDYVIGKGIDMITKSGKNVRELKQSIKNKKANEAAGLFAQTWRYLYESMRYSDAAVSQYNVPEKHLSNFDYNLNKKNVVSFGLRLLYSPFRALSGFDKMFLNLNYDRLAVRKAMNSIIEYGLNNVVIGGVHYARTSGGRGWYIMDGNGVPYIDNESGNVITVEDEDLIKILNQRAKENMDTASFVMEVEKQLGFHHKAEAEKEVMDEWNALVDLYHDDKASKEAKKELEDIHVNKADLKTKVKSMEDFKSMGGKTKRFISVQITNRIRDAKNREITRHVHAEAGGYSAQGREIHGVPAGILYRITNGINDGIKTFKESKSTMIKFMGYVIDIPLSMITLITKSPSIGYGTALVASPISLTVNIIQAAMMARGRPFYRISYDALDRAWRINGMTLKDIRDKTGLVKLTFGDLFKSNLNESVKKVLIEGYTVMRTPQSTFQLKEPEVYTIGGQPGKIDIASIMAKQAMSTIGVSILLSIMFDCPEDEDCGLSPTGEKIMDLFKVKGWGSVKQWIQKNSTIAKITGHVPTADSFGDPHKNTVSLLRAGEMDLKIPLNEMNNSVMVATLTRTNDMIASGIKVTRGDIFLNYVWYSNFDILEQAVDIAANNLEEYKEMFIGALSDIGYKRAKAGKGVAKRIMQIVTPKVIKDTDKAMLDYEDRYMMRSTATTFTDGVKDNLILNTPFLHRYIDKDDERFKEGAYQHEFTDYQLSLAMQQEEGDITEGVGEKVGNIVVNTSGRITWAAPRGEVEKVKSNALRPGGKAEYVDGGWIKVGNVFDRMYERALDRKKIQELINNGYTEEALDLMRETAILVKESDSFKDEKRIYFKEK